MAEIWTSRTRQRQPQGAVGVDWNNPQAKGLALYWPFNSTGLRDFSGNQLNGSGSPVQVSTPYGVGRRFNGSNDVRVTPSERIKSSTKYTSCAFVKFDSFPLAYNTLISTAATTIGYRDLHVKSNGKLAVYVGVNGGASFYDGTGANTLTTGVWYHLAMTVSSSTAIIGYVNSRIDNSTSIAGNVDPLGGTSFVTVGNNPPGFGSRWINADVFDARVYDRVLSQAEITDVYRNPWQLFAPERRVSYYLPASGGVTVNATGVSATGAVGTVTATGASTYTASGVSATGSVGTVTATGASTYTASGVSATGSVGTVTTTGASTYTASGVSATGDVGTVTVSTTSAVTVNVTGVDATGAVGTVTVTGASTYTASGVTGTGAVGTVTVATDPSAIVLVSGVYAVGAVGSVNVWSVINNTQTPNWQSVDTVQTPAWTQTSTVQSPNWQ